MGGKIRTKNELRARQVSKRGGQLSLRLTENNVFISGGATPLCQVNHSKELAVRVIFFDIDGTLVRTNGAGKKALEDTLSEDFSVSEPSADIDYGGRTDLFDL